MYLFLGHHLFIACALRTHSLQFGSAQLVLFSLRVFTSSIFPLERLLEPNFNFFRWSPAQNNQANTKKKERKKWNVKNEEESMPNCNYPKLVPVWILFFIVSNIST